MILHANPCSFLGQRGSISPKWPRQSKLSFVLARIFPINSKSFGLLVPANWFIAKESASLRLTVAPCTTTSGSGLTTRRGDLRRENEDSVTDGRHKVKKSGHSLCHETRFPGTGQFFEPVEADARRCFGFDRKFRFAGNGGYGFGRRFVGCVDWEDFIVLSLATFWNWPLLNKLRESLMLRLIFSIKFMDFLRLTRRVLN